MTSFNWDFSVKKIEGSESQSSQDLTNKLSLIVYKNDFIVRTFFS